MSSCLGVVDKEERPAHPDRRDPNVHERPEVPVTALGRHGRVDAEDQLSAAARLRHVRVPGQHGAQDQSSLQSERRR